MKNITALHNEAMDWADRAANAARGGDQEQAASHTRRAFELERKAASLTTNMADTEPTRSVLHRSAASLALECGEIRIAEQLVGAALAGNPPESIADELRDLLEDIYFQRHMILRGVSLQGGEFQMSLEGAGVGFGIARSDQFVGRVKDLENLIYRTAERRLGREFRDAGRRKKKLSEELELYISTPRAASFAVTFRIGRSDQLSLPGFDFPMEVVDDLMDCIGLLNRGDVSGLKARIPDESYFLNFYGLARKLAPDGKEIRSVGFTTLSDNEERKVALSREKTDFVKLIPDSQPSSETVSFPRTIEITGHLLEADARNKKKGTIQIVADDKSRFEILVPRGMMSDIVKPYFDEIVLVRAHQDENGYHLDTIDAANDRQDNSENNTSEP